jgi:hypothetical protein
MMSLNKKFDIPIPNSLFIMKNEIKDGVEFVINKSIGCWKNVIIGIG